MENKGRNLTKLMFSPVFLYFVIWFLILFLYSLDIVSYPNLHDTFYIVIGANFIGMFFGFLQAKFIQKKLTKDQILFNSQHFFSWIEINKHRIKKTYNYLCFLAVSGVVLIYIDLFLKVSLTQFFFQQSYIKTEIERSLLGTYLSIAAYIALPLSACLDGDKSQWVYSKLPLTLTILYSISYWGRFPLLMAVSILISSRLLISLIRRQSIDFLRIRKRKVLLGIFKGVLYSILALLFLCWSIELRIAEYGEKYDPYANYYQESIITESLQSVGFLFGSFRAITITYSYLVASIPTLSYWVSMESEYGLGEATFPYVFRLFNKVGLINESNIVGDRVVDIGMQLPSFVGFLYIDFGWIGVLIFSYLLGAVGTSAYESFIKKPDMSTLMHLTLVYTLVLFSPITNIISQTIFPLIFIGYRIINYTLLKTQYN